jgi:hypothetical protein
MNILPKTKLGKWSLWLLAGFFLLLLFTTVIVVGLFNQEGGKTFIDNLYISIPMFSAFGSAIAAFVIGVVSVWKYKERALIIAIPIIIGLLVTLFILGEVTTPH